MKRKVYFLLIMLFALTMAGCSDDDKGIYFTKDEVEGDIRTGKQVGIEGNTVDVYTTEQNSVNVQGASGKITASSEDEGIVKIIACDNSETKKVVFMGVAEGKAKIVVTDEKGNTAKFITNVVNVEKAWKTSGMYSLDGKRCVVEGVGKEDSTEIASSVIANDKKALMYILYRGYIPTGRQERVVLQDKDSNVMLNGILNQTDDGQYVKCWVTSFESYSSVVLDQFCMDKKEACLIWDLTNVYREKYPAVNSVKLYVHLGVLYFRD